ncbi:MAG: serine/threonine protein kinase [Verrucomicrobia bacterium]|nr:serine/threonine protein kinase [Verrucomicrobiota bacterium]
MSPAASTCPRCRRSTHSPFGVGGLCLRCAGVRALAIDLEDSVEPSLDVPVPEVSAAPAGLPARIGPYEVIDELGRGGMARVFCARQPRLDRLVALKVLAGGPANEALEQRFLREIQTVARLRHPHIVAIHDSGRADGYVYFAMDYIEGGDLAHRLREQPPAPREIAALLEKTARALAYAHAEGVIHRDLKPSNILLDGEEPRLADFGLAAQIEAGGDLTMVSAIIGTPHYLAPEAVRGGSAALSPASDQYALGVILYEALAGRTPFAGASAAELPALLSHAEPPALRLLAPATPRDLETICLQCLEREPTRRYRGMAEFADDLARFLAGVEIVARPPGLGERFRRFARRHRTALAATSAATLTLTAGIVTSTTLAVRATRAEKRAAREAAAATAVVNFLQDDLLAQAGPEQQSDPDIRLRTVLDRASRSIGQRFVGQPDVEAPIREVLGVTYTSVGQYPVAREHLERALVLARQLYGPDDFRTLRIDNELASILVYTRKLPEAEAAKHRLFQLHRDRFGPDHRATLNTASDLAAVYNYQGKLKEAETLLRETIAREERVFGPNDPSTVNSRSILGVILTRRGRLQEAAAFVEETLRRARASLGDTHETTIVTLTSLAGIYGRLDQYHLAIPLLDEACQSGRKALGPEHPATLNAMNSLGVVYFRERRLDEAAALLGQVLETRRRTLEPDHPQTLNTSVTVAGLARERGQLDEAIQLATKVREVRLRLLGPTNADTARITDFLGHCLADRGKLQEALLRHVEALAARREKLGPEHFETLESVRTVAACRLQLGEAAAAEALLREALPHADQAQPGTWQTALARCQLGAALVRLGRAPEGRILVQENAALVRKNQEKIPALGRARILREVGAYAAEAESAR